MFFLRYMRVGGGTGIRFRQADEFGGNLLLQYLLLLKFVPFSIKLVENCERNPAYAQYQKKHCKNNSG